MPENMVYIYRRKETPAPTMPWYYPIIYILRIHFMDDVHLDNIAPLWFVDERLYAESADTKQQIDEGLYISIFVRRNRKL